MGSVPLPGLTKPWGSWVNWHERAEFQFCRSADLAVAHRRALRRSPKLQFPFVPPDLARVAAGGSFTRTSEQENCVTRVARTGRAGLELHLQEPKSAQGSPHPRLHRPQSP